MHVSVQWHHIGKANELNGQPTVARSCPVALAVCEQLHLEIGQVVVYGSIFFLDKNWHERPVLARTPKAVFEWIQDYDDGKPVEPIEFDVRLEAAY